MAHKVKCYYCGETFDRDEEEFALVTKKRYAHKCCALKENSDIKTVDPKDTAICCFCKKELSKSNSDTIKLSGGRYACRPCAAAETARPKSDSELLDLYLMKLFDVDYVLPNTRRQINSFIEQYGYTHSGIMKTLQFHYEIEGGDVSKAHMGIGIVPYVYKKAEQYYYNIWKAQQANIKKLKDEPLETKIEEVKILSPKREGIKRKRFTFLDDEVKE